MLYAIIFRHAADFRHCCYIKAAIAERLILFCHATFFMLRRFFFFSRAFFIAADTLLLTFLLRHASCRRYADFAAALFSYAVACRYAVCRYAMR